MGNEKAASVDQIASSNDLATIEGSEDSRRVEVKRILPYAINEVWDALIDPESVSQWFGKWSIDPREGGKIQLGFSSAIVSGSIKAFMPPNVFAYTWEQDGEALSIVQFDLVELGPDETSLTVVQTPLAGSVASDVAAGWHSMMDRLSHFLRSHDFVPQDTARWKELHATYQSQSN